MFEKNLRLAYLIDFYGDVLDAHTQRIMNAYYNDDLSLAEIAAVEGISRQGVRHVIKKGEDELLYLEEKLGLADRHERLCEAASRLPRIKERLSHLGDNFKGECELLDSLYDMILKQ